MKKLVKTTNNKATKRPATKKELKQKVEQGIRFTIATYGDVIRDLAQYDRGGKIRTR